MNDPVYRAFALRLKNYESSVRIGYGDLIAEDLELLNGLVSDYAPKDERITKLEIDLASSNANKLTFKLEYLHPSGAGDRREHVTRHKVTILPSLADQFMIHVTGPSRNGVRLHLRASFIHAFEKEILGW